jgi:hypothetical protein
MIVGAWDDCAGVTGTYSFWGRPMITWFYTNNMASAQAATETYWSNWLSAGVTAAFPDAAYNTLFKRSLLVAALHIDDVTGAIIAGMHNGAYPFVWPRDGVYAAVTLDRTGHTNEAAAFYTGCAMSPTVPLIAWTAVWVCFTRSTRPMAIRSWTSAATRRDRQRSVGAVLSLPNNWRRLVPIELLEPGVHIGQRQSSETSCVNSEVYMAFGLMNGNNVWEDSFGLFIYSNAAVSSAA